MRIAVLLLLVACANGGPSGPYGTDAPSTDPDAKTDPTGDAPPSMPVTCGGSICVAGQTCNAGACTFGCVGATVPGDYATLQTAVDALAAAGQDATICVGTATLTEATVFVRDQMNHGKTLQIIGESVDKSTINSEIYVQAGWNKVTIKGVHISVPTNRTALRSSLGVGGKLTVSAAKLTGQSGLDISGAQEVLVDGTDITATGGYGVTTYLSSGQANVRIENSYFRGTGYSVRGSTYSGGGTLQLQFVGNTVIGPSVGIDLSVNTTALIANSIFTGTTSYAMTWTNTTTVTRQNNALWNNQTNYSGLASDGANYLKIDCMLDMAPRIPTLLPGSPCRDVGDASVSSNHDFHGTARGTVPDLGAVEAL